MTIRFKLTTSVIAVILVANLLFSFITLQYLNHVWMREVQTRVRRNLNAARAAYGNHLDVMAALLRGTARDRTLVPALKATLNSPPPSGRGAEGGGKGLGWKQPSPFFGTGAETRSDVARPDGARRPGLRRFSGARRERSSARSGGKRSGDDLSADPLVAGVLRERKPVSGTVVLSAQRLSAEGRTLPSGPRSGSSRRKAARPAGGTAPHRRAWWPPWRCPCSTPAEQVQAVLYGGDLLNQRYEIVDAIKQQVFRGRSVPRQADRRGDHLPGGRADFHQLHRRKTARGRWGRS